MNFFSKSPMNLSKTRVKKLSKAYARFSEDPDAINDVQDNIISLLLIFNKSVVFRQQMLFFHSNFDFYSNECTDTWKINICCRKTTYWLKMSNNDAMLLCWSFKELGTQIDHSNQNQFSTLKFWENLNFEKVLN